MWLPQRAGVNRQKHRKLDIQGIAKTFERMKRQYRCRRMDRKESRAKEKKV